MKIGLKGQDRLQAGWLACPLAIDRILYEAEQPIVFLKHSSSGRSLLAYLAHKSACGIDYILASTSPRKIQQLKQGAIGVREALCADSIWILRQDTEANSFNTWSNREEMIRDDYPPVPGTGLRHEHSV